MHLILARHAEQLFGGDQSFVADSLRRLAKGMDPALAERCVHALEYVAQLTHTSVPFVFTGGTAAQLLLAGGIQRLSKDVDVISTEGGPDRWAEVVRAIAARFHGEVYQATTLANSRS